MLQVEVYLHVCNFNTHRHIASGIKLRKAFSKLKDNSLFVSASLGEELYLELFRKYDQFLVKEPNWLAIGSGKSGNQTAVDWYSKIRFLSVFRIHMG
jgi:hypothetical protein